MDEEKQVELIEECRVLVRRAMFSGRRSIGWAKVLSRLASRIDRVDDQRFRPCSQSNQRNSQSANASRLFPRCFRTCLGVNPFIETAGWSSVTKDVFAPSSPSIRCSNCFNNSRGDGPTGDAHVEPSAVSGERGFETIATIISLHFQKQRNLEMFCHTSRIRYYRCRKSRKRCRTKIVAHRPSTQQNVTYKAGTKVQPPMNNAFQTSIATQQLKYWFLQQVKRSHRRSFAPSTFETF